MRVNGPLRNLQYPGDLVGGLAERRKGHNTPLARRQVARPLGLQIVQFEHAAKRLVTQMSQHKRRALVERKREPADDDGGLIREETVDRNNHELTFAARPDLLKERRGKVGGLVVLREPRDGPFGPQGDLEQGLVGAERER